MDSPDGLAGRSRGGVLLVCRRWLSRLIVPLIGAAAMMGAERTDRTSADGAWILLEQFPARTEEDREVRPRTGQALWLNWGAMHKTLQAAPEEATVASVRLSPATIWLPRPDGVFERFALVESSIMEPALRDRAPEIRTYLGQGLDTPSATVRLDRTPQGFHAQVLAPSAAGVTRTYYIDPVSRGDRNHCVSHWRGVMPAAPGWTCGTPQPDPDRLAARSGFSPRGPLTVRRREYRLAMAATGEYTVFASAPNLPSALGGLGGVVTTVNRVNQILENDCAVRLILVANSLDIIFVDPNTDPYSGTLGQMQFQNQSTLDGVIGTSNYDVGHLVDRNTGGGNAGGIGTVCQELIKGQGYTASQSPVGTSFWVDYVAHEIGHQLGATHTFNGNQSNCGAQRTASTAYEPGSGSSIMGYAGICGSDNLATANPPTGASDPMFSLASIDQITLRASLGTCPGDTTPTSNHHPVAAMGQSFTVPTNTPFALHASGSDQDFGDSLSYSWEQQDLGPQLALGADTGQHEPLFRTFMHDGSGDERSFPHWITVLTGTPLLGENPVLAPRSSTFGFVVRDNVAGAGGVGRGYLNIQFAASTGGGFRVTAPAAGTYCAGQQVPVTWTVAGTGNPPVSCELVDIAMSLDGGQTFPHALGAGIANSGLALVTLPPLEVANARIRVSAVGNVFYAVNPGPMQVQAQPPQFTGFTAWPACSTTCPGASVVVVPSPVSGSQPIQLALQMQNGATWVDAQVATPGDLFSFAPLTRLHSGNYRIVARNGCGTAVTAERRIEVGVSFDLQPAAQIVDPCTQAVFNVQARGACSVTYQWLRNGSVLSNGDLGGRVSGATSPTLTIAACRYEDEGAYGCRVTDSCESRESAWADLRLPTPRWAQTTMNAAPAIAGAVEYWTSAYDERRGVMVLYGGLTQTGQNSNALWEYDGYSWTVRQPGYPSVSTNLNQPLFDGFFPPTPAACAMVYNPDDQKIYLIGPYAGNYPLAVYAWDGAAWTRPYFGPVNGETARTHAVWDPTHHRIVMVRSVGGSHNSEMLMYDPATNQMSGPTLMQPAVQLGVHDSHLWWDQKRGRVLWYNNINQFVDPTMWALGADDVWTQLAGSPPRLAYAAQVAYDPVRYQATTMGGLYDGSSWYSGTLGWPGLATYPWLGAMPPANDWTAILPDGPPRNPAGLGYSPPNNWSPRSWTAMVFDQRRRSMVAAGVAFQSAPPTAAWQTYERRYLDKVVFDRTTVPEVIAPGNIVRFNAYAAGWGAGGAGFTHQWRKNSVDLSDGPAPGGGVFSGTHSDVLTITGVGPADNGAYTCVVTNACGVATTVVARLGCVADFDHIGGTTVQDIFAFLAAWFNGDASADVNGLGGITVQDIFDFLNTWFAGC